MAHLDDSQPRSGAARTPLAWLLVTAFVATVAMVTVAVSARLGAHGRPPVVTLLLAAVVVSAALPWVWRHAERLAGRLVLGDRVDAYALVSDFVRSSASTLPMEEVMPRLAETAARTVRSPRGEVRVWLSDGEEWREAWPVDHPGATAAVNVGVIHDGRAVGELEVSLPDADAAGARRRLAALAGPAGLALSTVQLTVDLRRRLDELARTEAELQASGRRLVEARLEERRRFVGTVESFVRPHLDAAATSLRLASTAPADELETVLTGAARHGEAALESLRSLAHGVFPVLLLQAGLAETLRTWAEASGVALDVRGESDADLARRAPTAVAVQYFACVEALHELAPAGAAVELSEADGTAWLALDWSATGASTLDPGTTLHLADRAEAIGGTLAVHAGGLRLSVPMPSGAPRPRGPERGSRP